jgi:RNA polymerase sigma factor (sigma-70 family)
VADTWDALSEEFSHLLCRLETDWSADESACFWNRVASPPLVNQLWGVARRALRDPELAQDVVQQCLMSLAVARKWDPRRRTSLAAWVFSWLRNFIRNARRGRRRYENHFEAYDPDQTYSGFRTLPQIERQLSASQQHLEVAAALSTLHPIDQGILRRHLIDDVPLSVLAEEMNLPPSTVRMRKLRALRALRRQLDSDQR